MDIKSLDELAALIAERDDISIEEAEDIVGETQSVITDAAAERASYSELEGILADYLGLEMDYIFLFL